MRETDYNNLPADLLVEANMSAKALAEVTKDPLVIMGFELEFWAIPTRTPVEKTVINFYKLLSDDEEVARNWIADFLEPTTTKAKVRSVVKKYTIERVKDRMANAPERLRTELAEWFMSGNVKWSELFRTEADILEMLDNKVMGKPARLKKLSVQMYTDMWDWMDYAFDNKKEALANPGLKLRVRDPHDYDYTISGKINKRTGNITILKKWDDDNYGPDDTEMENILAKELPNVAVERVDTDGSLNNPKGNNDTGLEIVSKPLPIGQSIENLKILFAWMKEKKYYTNAECGLHMSVSYKNKTTTRRIDPLKFIMFIGEEYVLDLFERNFKEDDDYNAWAPTHVGLLKDRETDRRELSGGEDGIDLTRTPKIKKWLKKVRNELTVQKYSSVNLSKLEEEGYLEVRMAGNSPTSPKLYNERVDDVISTALRYGRVLQIAMDKDVYYKQYIKKVMKFIDIVKGKHEKVAPTVAARREQEISKMSNRSIFISGFKRAFAAMIDKDTDIKRYIALLSDIGPDATPKQRKAKASDTITYLFSDVEYYLEREYRVDDPTGDEVDRTITLLQKLFEIFQKEFEITREAKRDIKTTFKRMVRAAEEYKAALDDHLSLDDSEDDNRDRNSFSMWRRAWRHAA